MNKLIILAVLVALDASLWPLVPVVNAKVTQYQRTLFAPLNPFPNPASQH
jgi:hypothetical protein